MMLRDGIMNCWLRSKVSGGRLDVCLGPEGCLVKEAAQERPPMIRNGEDPA